jgi:hypothetical protein
MKILSSSRPFKAQQDGAVAHTAEETITSLKKKYFHPTLSSDQLRRLSA